MKCLPFSQLWCIASFHSWLLLLLLLVLLLTHNVKAVTYTDEQRIAGYHARNYTWPPPKFQPDTPGWNKLMAHRIRQGEEIQDEDMRRTALMSTLTAGLLQANYTPYGFGLARAPNELMNDLRMTIRKGLEDGPPPIEKAMKKEMPVRPWFIRSPQLTDRVLHELKPYAEAWSGIQLTPQEAYGFRVYRNESSLYMHVDKPETHIISFILHIDSSEDAEPWPIYIEDFQGNTHEVILKSGDILFYESSKCFHGRPKKFNGSWYSSLFVHYYPKYGYRESFDPMEPIYALPLHVLLPPLTPYVEIPLVIHAASMEEPTCPNGWCATQHTIKWSGPGQEGYWIAPTGEKFPFDPTLPPPCKDKEARCDEWSRWDSNECVRNKKYMMQFCPKSCKVCGEEDDTTTATTTNISDNNAEARDEL